MIVRYGVACKQSVVAPVNADSPIQQTHERDSFFRFDGLVDLGDIQIWDL